MAIKPLPTGNEPPKGYESLYTLPANNDVVRVRCTFISQLASIELAEIEELRTKALASISNIVGLANDTVSFERETNVIPGKSASDKMLFRAYKGNTLTGYALVINGWPQQGDWVIQHMLIDPDFRLQGVGTSIVTTIEEYALTSEVDATSIYAIPIQESGTNFWSLQGYSVEAQRYAIQPRDSVYELQVYRKGLPTEE
ncbi:MAG: GNAT family N-acetyltransferase [Coriobacteriales bacterium]|jgi:GNAT superfamily N-acetyltransferase|nr:GNAT family N-acetyltransferase [Coriobacteriales bacterium]